MQRNKSILSFLFPEDNIEEYKIDEITGIVKNIKVKDIQNESDNEYSDEEFFEENESNPDEGTKSQSETELSNEDPLFPEKHYEKEAKSKYGDDADSALVEQMEKDEDFKNAMKRSFKNEGGYPNRAGDPGGETKYGISTAQYGYTEDIKNIEKDRAKFIYYRDYYKGPGYDKLPDGIREQVFDAGIYKGQPTATRILQQKVGAKVDGRLGPETISKTNSMDKHELSKGLFDAFNKDNDEKMKNNPRLETNRNGWYNRNKRMTIMY